VEVSGDMRTAKVYVSIMGDEKKQTLGLRGLQSAAGFLQAKVANRIDTRYTPRLAFVLDQGVKKSLEVNRILREVLPVATEDAESEMDPGDLNPAATDSPVNTSLGNTEDASPLDREANSDLPNEDSSEVAPSELSP
jgi:ribosome-binding factor A